MIGVLAYPIAWEVWVSLTDLSPLNDGGPRFVGLANYVRLAQDPQFWHAAVVTIVYAAVTGVVKLAVGMGFALILRRPFRGRAFVFFAVFLSLTAAFSDLANVWMLTAGRIVFPVVGTHAYWLAIKSGQFGRASALSLTLVPFLLAALVVLFWLFDRPDPRPAREAS